MAEHRPKLGKPAIQPHCAAILTAEERHVSKARDHEAYRQAGNWKLVQNVYARPAPPTAPSPSRRACLPDNPVGFIQKYSALQPRERSLIGAFRPMQDGAVGLKATEALGDLVADVAGLDAREDEGIGIARDLGAGGTSAGRRPGRPPHQTASRRQWRARAQASGLPAVASWESLTVPPLPEPLVEKLSSATFGSMPKNCAQRADSTATSASFCAAEKTTLPSLSTVSS